MNDLNEQQLEKALADMTNWEGEAPTLWKTALEGTKQRSSIRAGVLQTIGAWPMWRKIVAAAAVLVIAVSGVNLLLQPYGDSQNISALFFSSPSTTTNDNLRYFGRAHAMYAIEGNGRSFLGGGGGGESFLIDGDVTSGVLPGGGWGGGSELDSTGRLAPQETEGSDDGRAVIRKSTIHLKTKDVRAVYLQATHMINEARGEFIDESSLQGDEESLQGSIALRVAADRLSEVLNELRELADVVAEQSKGDDVTSQMIDLDARLRNEQRVEVELLELLESRDDAPLKEVLQLREEISGVRATIERLQAQQARLSKMVELATILVFIRHDHAPVEEIEKEEEGSIGSYFMDKVSDAWVSGLEFLARTVATLVQILIGGMVWWLIFAVCIFGIRSLLKQQKAKEAAALTAPVE